MPAMKTRPRFWLVLPALLLAAAAGYFLLKNDGPPPAQYRTAPVERGEVVQSVAANGTLNPVTLVNVGTQISGTIQRLHADFNQPVQAGQVLAELDPALTRANLADLEAILANTRAAEALARTKLARSEALVARNFISPSQLDDDRQALTAASAARRSAEAKLQRERTNLGYTVIRAPITGVVVARSVDVGQTVAASFQTPTLFQIAQDLTKMQIDTAVAEADVGAIRVDQPASFTVDAYPGQRFSARVKQIRLNPTIQQNVVTYNVVLATDNPDKLLLPGMTAQARIEIARKAEVLRIPNAALRFRPEAKNGEARQRPPGQPGAVVYRLDAEGKLERVAVTTGLTDRSHTEQVEGPLSEGMELVVGETLPAQPRPAATPSQPGNMRMRLF
jgi:HlyD family secretion protein